jgi:hypothetical protein
LIEGVNMDLKQKRERIEGIFRDYRNYYTSLSECLAALSDLGVCIVEYGSEGFQEGVYPLQEESKK